MGLFHVFKLYKWYQIAQSISIEGIVLKKPKFDYWLKFCVLRHSLFFEAEFLYFIPVTSEVGYNEYAIFIS